MKVLKTFLLVFLPLATFAQIDVDSDIQDVTIYQKGAMVSRMALVKVQKGDNEIIFTDLTHKVNKKSIRALTSEGVALVSVGYKVNYIQPKADSRRVKQIKDSLEIFEVQLANEQNIHSVYKEEEAMILANKSIKGNQTLEAIDVEEMANFYRKRLTTIKSAKLNSALKIKKLQATVTGLKKSLEQIGVGNEMPTGEIRLVVNAAKDQNCNLTVRYMVWDASWSPTYDIRAKDTKSALNVSYKAKVYQNTGIDWEDVKLTLSTGNPSADGTAPKLTPWKLKDVTAMQMRRQEEIAEREELAKAKYRDTEGRKMADKSMKREDVTEQWQTTAIIQSPTTTEFNITSEYTIESGTDLSLVQISQHKLGAEYQHLCIPKLNKDVFLMARIANWEKVNWLPGEASIFFENSFVGTSRIDPNQATDTLEISLGKDKGVIVQRTMSKEFNSSKIIGSSMKKSVGWDLQMKNTKGTQVNLIVLDQVPLTTNKAVVVELESAENAQHNERSGQLKWKISMPPRTIKKENFKYTVKYPKSMNLNL